MPDPNKADDLDFGPVDVPDDGASGFDPEGASPAPDNPDDAQNLGPDGETPPAGKGKEEPPADSAAEARIKDLSKRLEDLSNDPDVLEARARRLRGEVYRPQPEPIREPEQPKGPTAEEQAAAEKELLDELAHKPLQAIAKIAAEVARRTVQAQTGNLSGSVFTTVLNQYRMQRGGSPLFRTVKPAFEKMIAGIKRDTVSNLSADQVWELLATTERLALGNMAADTYESRVAAGAAADAGFVDNEPPDMGSRGGAGERPVARGAKGRKIRPQDVPREYISLGRAGGLTDRQIYDDYVAQMEENA